MIEFPRNVFVMDASLHRLYTLIKEIHKPAEHTAKVLFENRHVKDFCEIARHFVMMPGHKDLYIHYDVCSWYDPKGALVKIESIGVYEDFMEYETARMKGLHSGNSSDIPNIN